MRRGDKQQKNRKRTEKKKKRDQVSQSNSEGKGGVKSPRMSIIKLQQGGAVLYCVGGGGCTVLRSTGYFEQKYST